MILIYFVFLVFDLDIKKEPTEVSSEKIILIFG